jgi:hypothetical protein
MYRRSVCATGQQFPSFAGFCEGDGAVRGEDQHPAAGLGEAGKITHCVVSAMYYVTFELTILVLEITINKGDQN